MKALLSASGRWSLGVFALLVLGAGILAGGLAWWYLAPTVLTAEELLASPEAYLDQYVEVQGVVAGRGNSACTGGKLLFSPTNVNRHMELRAPSSINVDKIDGPAVVWGRIIQAPDRCGFNNLYFEVQAAEPIT
jgi:hypothetical protein